MLSKKILEFLFSLKLPFKLPDGVGVMDVYNNNQVIEACSSFYNKYYSDLQPRILIFGINPGRFGGGITGIPFTDPVRLEECCRIKNNFLKKQELSSVFIYEMIAAFGGPENFYLQYCISAISPLGFVKHNKNLNYYDDKMLLKRIEPFIINCMEIQLSFGMRTDICFCIGESDNYLYLKKLNDYFKWFQQIKPLPHPRFIMQYRLKKKQQYIDEYCSALKPTANFLV